MSTYHRLTKNPRTKKWQTAVWHDDWFGPRNYGVEFPDGKGIVYDPRRVVLETKEWPDNGEEEPKAQEQEGPGTAG